MEMHAGTLGGEKKVNIDSSGIGEGKKKGWWIRRELLPFSRGKGRGEKTETLWDQLGKGMRGLNPSVRKLEGHKLGCLPEDATM